MRYRQFGMAAAAALTGCMAFGLGAHATPISATYTDETKTKAPTFEAVFYYDSDSLVQDATDPTLFNGTGGLQYATLSYGGASYSFDASSYFYERVISGITPDYEFGIRQTDGAFMYLIVNGATQYGRFDLVGGTGGADLEPTRVTIEPFKEADVSPVPLPPAAALFGAGLLALGLAGVARGRKAVAA